MKLLITRPQPDADIFADLCRVRGLSPVICPLMTIEPLECEFVLDGIGALAFTSANGVRAFARNHAERQLPVFAVGDVSAAVARTEGFETVYIAAGDVIALATYIFEKRQTFSGDILHIAGSRRAGDLVAALASQGIMAQRQVLYGTREAFSMPTPALEALCGARPVDWVTLFSPRSAVLLARLVAQSGIEAAIEQRRVVCLSEAVAQKARLLKWKSVEIAAGRNVAAMIELMLRT